MKAFAKALWLYGAEIDADEFRTICIFSGAGLLVSLLVLMSCGLEWWSALALPG